MDGPKDVWPVPNEDALLNEFEGVLSTLVWNEVAPNVAVPCWVLENAEGLVKVLFCSKLANAPKPVPGLIILLPVDCWSEDTGVLSLPKMDGLESAS